MICAVPTKFFPIVVDLTFDILWMLIITLSAKFCLGLALLFHDVTVYFFEEHVLWVPQNIHYFLLVVFFVTHYAFD